VTIVDVEQLGGAMTENLASLFEEEPKVVAARKLSPTSVLSAAKPALRASGPQAMRATAGP
jgi:cobaltochelatase CobT